MIRSKDLFLRQMDTLTDADWEELERREAEDADADHLRRCEEYTETVLSQRQNQPEPSDDDVPFD